jgi:hypothetical protein
MGFGKSSLNIHGATTCSSTLNIIGSINAPNITRKKGFSFTCSTPVTLNGAQYYRYDIDLNLYTTFVEKYYGQTLSNKTRKFKWMSWLTTGSHELGFNLNYDIAYSYKYIPPLNGLFVSAYGWPYDNKTLSLVHPDKHFLLRNTFDYLTFCCKIQHTLVSGIIIDYL